jgi:hypothetical protein
MRNDADGIVIAYFKNSKQCGLMFFCYFYEKCSMKMARWQLLFHKKPIRNTGSFNDSEAS